MLHVVLQCLDQLVAGPALVFLGQHHGSLDHHASDGVGHARHGTFHHGGMGHQRAFHLERSDAVSRAFDHVVGTSHKPVVAVFVAPSDVAGVVDAVVPHLVCQLLVTVIALEQSDGLAPACVDTYLTLLAVLAVGALGSQQPDVVLWRRLAHRAGFGCDPRECSQGHGGLGLPESLHDLQSGALVELGEDRGFEGLAGRGAVLQRR